jgi:DNA-directed RNA polymerase specialized sigma24 family protein
MNDGVCAQAVLWEDKTRYDSCQENRSNVLKLFSREATLSDQYFDAKSADIAEKLLERLNHEEIRPFMKRAVSRRLASSLSNRGVSLDARLTEDINDVVQDATVHVVLRLIQMRQEGTRVDNLTGYMGRTADNACNQLYRRHFRVRYNVSKRVDGLLRDKKLFSDWIDARGERHGVLTAWKSPPPTPRPEAIEVLNRNPSEAAEESSRRYPVQNASSGVDPRPKPAACLYSVLNWCAGFVEVDLLISLVQAARNEFDLIRVEDADAEETRAPARDTLDTHAVLSAIWRALNKIQPSQAQVLLLNLQLGSAGIELFPAHGIATLEEIAKLLQIEVNEVAHLPLQNKEIGERLGKTESAVNTARQVARAALHAQIVRDGSLSAEELRFEI